MAEVAQQLLWLHRTSLPLLTERFVASGDAAAWTTACGVLSGDQAATSDCDESDEGDGDEGDGDGEHVSEEQEASKEQEASEEQEARGSEHGAEEEGSGGEGEFDDPLEALAQLALGKLAAAEEPVEANTEEKLDQLGKLFNDLAAGMDQVRLLVQYPTMARKTMARDVRVQ